MIEQIKIHFKEQCIIACATEEGTQCTGKTLTTTASNGQFKIYFSLCEQHAGERLSTIINPIIKNLISQTLPSINNLSFTVKPIKTIDYFTDKDKNKICIVAIAIDKGMQTEYKCDDAINNLSTGSQRIKSLSHDNPDCLVNYSICEGSDGFEHSDAIINKACVFLMNLKDQTAQQRATTRQINETA